MSFSNSHSLCCPNSITSLWFSLWLLIILLLRLSVMIREWIFQAQSFINMGFTHQGEGCHRHSPKSLQLWDCDSFTDFSSSSCSSVLACIPGYYFGSFCTLSSFFKMSPTVHSVISLSWMIYEVPFLNLRPLCSAYQCQTLEEAFDRW